MPPSPLTPRHINILMWIFLFSSPHPSNPTQTHTPPHTRRRFCCLPYCSSVPFLWHCLHPPSSAFIPVFHIPLVFLWLLPGLSSVSQGCPGSTPTTIQPSSLTKMLILCGLSSLTQKGFSVNLSLFLYSS